MLAHYFISALCIFIGIILLQTLAKEKPAANRNRLITSLIYKRVGKLWAKSQKIGLVLGVPKTQMPS